MKLPPDAIRDAFRKPTLRQAAYNHPPHWADGTAVTCTARLRLRGIRFTLEWRLRFNRLRRLEGRFPPEARNVIWRNGYQCRAYYRAVGIG